MPRAELWDAYGRPTGHINFPDPEPAGGYGDAAPMGPLARLVVLVLGFAVLIGTVVMVVIAANEPNPGEPGYCSSSDKIVVGHNWAGVPQYVCPSQ